VDQQRSRRFYETYFGFACNGELDSEGCLHLKDADGFDVTLARRPDISPPSSLHFGIRLADPDSVHRLLTRLSAENVETGELFASHHRVAFHCFDPDGYRVEVFWSA
jgi:catechol 2,3-dioxygenase-like lactoylglutathione lyase family enzyme